MRSARDVEHRTDQSRTGKHAQSTGRNYFVERCGTCGCVAVTREKEHQ